ncbi:hypothetical protein WME98_28730 [Sorangium sp. So ce296]|uniref:hypothetical protein n=1 Tax=Sorangium sp. So ce296 TaxID=3133296 RepID=UPI003F5F4DB4
MSQLVKHEPGTGTGLPSNPRDSSSPGLPAERSKGRLIRRLLAGCAVIGALFFAYELGARATLPERERQHEDAPNAAPGAEDLAQHARADERAAGAASPPVPPVDPGPPSSEPAESPRGPSPREHRDRVLRELRASGPDHRLFAPASAVVDAWTSKLAKLGAAGTFEPLECYAKGCSVTVVHASAVKAEEATEVITRTGEFHGWQAGKMRSGLIEHDGDRVEVTWILDAPPPDSPVLPEALPRDNLDELVERGSGR